MGIDSQVKMIAFDADLNPVNDGRVGSSEVAPFRFVPGSVAPIPFQLRPVAEYEPGDLSNKPIQTKNERKREYVQLFADHIKGADDTYRNHVAPELKRVQDALSARLEAYRKLREFLARSNDQQLVTLGDTTRKLATQLNDNRDSINAFEKANTMAINEYLTRFSTDLEPTQEGSISLSVKGVTLLRTLKEEEFQTVETTHGHLLRFQQFLETNTLPRGGESGEKIGQLDVQYQALSALLQEFNAAKGSIESLFAAISRTLEDKTLPDGSDIEKPFSLRDVWNAEKPPQSTDDIVEKTYFENEKVKRHAGEIVQRAAEISRIIQEFTQSCTQYIAFAFEIQGDLLNVDEKLGSVIENIDQSKRCNETLLIVTRLLNTYEKTIVEIERQVNHETRLKIQTAAFLKRILQKNLDEERRRKEFCLIECKDFPILENLLNKPTPVPLVSVNSFPVTPDCKCEISSYTFDGKTFKSTEVARNLLSLNTVSAGVEVESTSVEKFFGASAVDGGEEDDSCPKNDQHVKIVPDADSAPSTFIDAPGTQIGDDAEPLQPPTFFDESENVLIPKRLQVDRDNIPDQTTARLYQRLVTCVQDTTTSLVSGNQNATSVNQIKDLIEAAQVLMNTIDVSATPFAAASVGAGRVPTFAFEDPNNKILLERFQESIQIIKKQQELIDRLRG